MVDKNLFLHDLAVVAILKNEGHYLKEWLDYHLLAGVDHFYLYDNDSTDNQAEVAAPYIKAGLVDYFYRHGNLMQHSSYNDAVKQFKFHCRYMAFIDADEFIYPKLTGGGIVEVVDEILSHYSNAMGLAINWQCFGSNGQENADYSRGVLERFTRRAPKDFVNSNRTCKTLANPRTINFVPSAHYAFYFEGLCAINGNGDVVKGRTSQSIHTEKIVLNHYRIKSKEEYIQKGKRGCASDLGDIYTKKIFDDYDLNDEFDDDILKYRETRMQNFQMPDKFRATERLLNALTVNLSPTFLPNTPPDFYQGKMETFLTCRAVSSILKTILPDNTPAKFFEEASLKAILQSFVGMNLAEARLFIRELPNLLNLPYPVVKDIRLAAIKIIPQMINTFRLNYMFRDYVEFGYLQDLLKLEE